MESFWQTLSKPILALAPMEDVTDTVFRRIVASCSRPDVFFTEFTSCEGLLSAGYESVAQRLVYTEEERPIVAQIWGKKPENFYAVAKLLVARGFDGIDINFGCPERAIVKQGACAAMIGQNALVKEIIDAVKHGVEATGRNIPVSVKTRLGYKTLMTEEWISFLLGLGLDALTVHGRTAAEMSAQPARWDEIAKAVDIRNRLKLKTVIIGNGDVPDTTDAFQKAAQYGVDGVMIGRGVFENLWAFDRSAAKYTPTVTQHLDIMMRHVALFGETWGTKKNFSILKKFFKIYIRGFEGASDWRMRFISAKNQDEVASLMKELMPQVRAS